MEVAAPILGVTNVGEVDNTTEPVPVRTVSGICNDLHNSKGTPISSTLRELSPVITERIMLVVRLVH
jgi:hypothetical protein